MGLFFSSSVREENGFIIVNHVRTETMQNDIQRVFKTSRVNKYMFHDMGKNSFKIRSFFAMELYYVIDKMINFRRKVANVRDLKEIQEGLLKNTWMSGIEKEHPARLDLSRLSLFKLSPKSFQMDFLVNYRDNVTRYNLRGMLLAGTAGSGKTLLGLFAAECANAERVVIVCPKNALYRVWEDTINEQYRVQQTYWIYDQGKPYNGERFLIFHYESLSEYERYVEYIKQFKCFVILDESHNLNEIKSLRTNRFLDFCNAIDASDVILASGTPIKAIAIETISLFRAIDPLFTPDVELAFRKLYQGEASTVTDILSQRISNVSFKIEKSELGLQDPIFKDIKVSIDNPEPFTLKAIADEMAVFIKERQVHYNKTFKDSEKFFYQCLDVAFKAYLSDRNLSRSERNFRQTQIDLYEETLRFVIKAHLQGSLRYAGKEMAICTQLEKEIITPYLPDKETRDKFKDLKSVVKYVTLKIQGECLGRVLGRKRIDVHLAMVPFVDFGEIINSSLKKTVIFSTYVEVIEATEALLKKEDFHPVTVYGKNTSDLNKTIQLFDVSPSINPLLATYASLSTAVPLVMADTMIMINTPFRNYIFEQAVSRIHRLGANTQPCIYTLSLDTGEEPNISSRTVDILKWSQDQVAKIMKTEVSYKLDEEGDIGLESFFEELHEELIIPDDTAPSLEAFGNSNILTNW